MKTHTGPRVVTELSLRGGAGSLRGKLMLGRKGGSDFSLKRSGASLLGHRGLDRSIGRLGARAIMALTRSEKSHEREAGFTLIEMMVVVAIIALMAALAIPTIASYFNVSLTSTSREIAGTIKETYNATVVTGQLHRIVYDIKEGTYWVESGPADFTLDTKASREREARKKRLSMSSDKKAESPFKIDKTVTRKKISLPTGVSFEDIQTQQSEEPISEGTAYTHFFPHGLIEQTVIHLKDSSKHQVSLVIQPIVGKTDMYERYLTAKEAFSGGK